METVACIRAARWADKYPVAALIADALQPSPLAAWLVPDPQQRRQVLTDVAAIWVEHAMFFGDHPASASGGPAGAPVVSTVEDLHCFRLGSRLRVAH